MTKVVMTDKEISSFLGATLINMTSEYCEATKQDFGKLFMVGNQSPAVLDVVIKVNGHEMDVTQFFAKLTKQMDREIRFEAKNLVTSIMYRAGEELEKAIKIETEE